MIELDGNLTLRYVYLSKIQCGIWDFKHPDEESKKKKSHWWLVDTGMFPWKEALFSSWKEENLHGCVWPSPIPSWGGRCDLVGFVAQVIPVVIIGDIHGMKPKLTGASLWDLKTLGERVVCQRRCVVPRALWCPVKEPVGRRLQKKEQGGTEEMGKLRDNQQLEVLIPWLSALDLKGWRWLHLHFYFQVGIGCLLQNIHLEPLEAKISSAGHQHTKNEERSW